MEEMEKEPIKSLLFSDPANLKPGDKVFIGGMPHAEWKEEHCPLCHVPTDEELQSPSMAFFTDEQLCASHRIDTLIHEIASKHTLRIEQWRDGSGAWRAGIEWYSDTQYEFICEKPTLLDCLICIKAHYEPKP
jgi:hypothetical protein